MKGEILLKITTIILFSLGMLNGNMYAQNFEMEWARGVGSTAGDFTTDVTVDEFGNVYTIGKFRDTVRFEPSTDYLVSKGNNDIYIVKNDKDGNLIWAKSFGGNKDDGTPYINISIDSIGYLYVSGNFTDTAYFDTHTLVSTGAADCFVAKLDTAGNIIWINRFGNTKGIFFTEIDVMKQGDFVITGYLTDDTVDFNPGAGITNLSASYTMYGTFRVGHRIGFVVKYNTNGELIWAKQIGGQKPMGDLNIINDVAVDYDGSVLLTGSFQDTVDFDPGLGVFNFATSDVWMDAFVWKLDSLGNFLWVKKMGGEAKTDVGRAIATDKYNNIYATGIFYTDTAISFNNPNLSSTITGNGQYDIYIVKFAPDGSYIWHKTFGGTLTEGVNGIAVDDAGNNYTTGVFRGTVDFNQTSPGTNIVTSYGHDDAFILKLDSAGNFGWTRRFGSVATPNNNNAETGNKLFVDGSRNLYGTGSFRAVVDFNENASPSMPITSHGTTDGYTLKLACVDTASSYQTVSACLSYTFNGIVYNQTGIYTQKYWSAGGCDSIVTLDLTIHTIDEPFITVNNFELGVTGGAFSTYQWLLNGSTISGATNATYIVNGNGDYQVVVTNEHGCSDTSEVYIVNNVSIHERNALAAQIKVFPNPSKDVVYINAPVNINIQLTTLDGRIVINKENSNQFSLKSLSSGVYFLRILDNDNRLIKVEKVVKE